jgi:hypothetical protein
VFIFKANHVESFTIADLRNSLHFA